MEDFERDMKLTFIEEATQLLAEVEECFLKLEDNPGDTSTLEIIFRLAHNLKGSAKAVGFDSVNTFCHEFENFLLVLKRGEIPLTNTVIGVLLTSTDHVRFMIDALKANLDATFDSTEALERIVACRQNPQGDTAVGGANDSGFHLFESDETVAPPAPSLVAEAEAAPRKLEIAPKPIEGKAPTESRTASQDDTIRVSLGRLETLINTVGEMVILQSVLNQLTHQSGDSLNLRKTAHQMHKVTKEIQDVAMSLRMVRLKPLFQKMQRICRDTASLLHKNIDFVMVGEDTEVDKTVFERISDPLVHLIRNAADHGVETPEERKAAGKPEEGTIQMGAFHQGGKLVIEIQDDGKGLNPQKLREAAITKGLIGKEKKLSDDEARALIFLPGFSSKSVVTDVSGRGVGMDVVRTNVNELGGDIHIQSTVGEGTLFRIELPLTLAIIDGMIIQAGTQKYVIPLSHVHETVRLEAKQLKTSTGIGEMLLLRDENLPLYRLKKLLALESAGKEEQENSAVVVRTQKSTFAIAIDEIVSSSQVVVKQLGKEAQTTKGVAGSTILGDGRPALILELSDLVTNYGHLSLARRRAA